MGIFCIIFHRFFSHTKSVFSPSSFAPFSTCKEQCEPRVATDAMIILTGFIVLYELCAEVTYRNTSSINSALRSDLRFSGITFRTKSYIVVFGGSFSCSCSNENTAIPFEIIATSFSFSVSTTPTYQTRANLM